MVAKGSNIVTNVHLNKIWHSSKEVVLAAVLTIFIVSSLRIFLFASFHVPTSSMQPAILSGDHVLVNKLIPGPRMDWLLLFANNTTSYRVDGHRSVAHGDVVVFNPPYHNASQIAKNLDAYFVKRCMGVPGDTLVIKAGNYKVKREMDSVSISRHDNGDLKAVGLDTFQPDMFKALGWTLADFGPAYIPRKDDKIRLDSVNIHLYKNLIAYETGGEVSFANNTCFLNNVPYPNHAFLQNYYFLAGDLATDSEDSRFWGLLPEDHIVGTVAFIWRSVDPTTKKHRLDRFLKRID